MTNLNRAANQLKNLVDQVLPQYTMPFKDGKTIHIGNTIVRRSKRHGFVIIDAENNSIVEFANTKHGAVAIAKAHNDGDSYTKLLERDQRAAKHLNDAVHYQHIINTTNDDDKKFILETRLEIAQDMLERENSVLESYILTQ